MKRQFLLILLCIGSLLALAEPSPQEIYAQAQALSKAGKPTEALASYRQLLATPALNASGELWAQIAECNRQLGNAIAAEAAIRHAIALLPDNDTLLLFLLQVVASQPNRENDTASLARQLLPSHSDDYRIWYVWAQAELNMKHNDKARDILETAARFNAATPDMLNVLKQLTLQD